MKRYEFVGTLVTHDSTVQPVFLQPAYKCPECGAVVTVLALHDTYHSKVDGMFRALDHLMDNTMQWQEERK